MEFAKAADIATIIASILAVIGVAWLVWTSVRRHRKVQEDYGIILDEMKRVTADSEDLDAAVKESIPLPDTHEMRVALLLTLLGRHLDLMSLQLYVLQLTSMGNFLRQHDAEEDMASLLTGWKTEVAHHPE